MKAAWKPERFGLPAHPKCDAILNKNKFSGKPKIRHFCPSGDLS
jgi:hypothetical protein